MTVATLALLDSPTHTEPVDAVIVGTAIGAGGVVLAPGAERLDEATDGRLAEALAILGATGKEGEVVKVATLGALPAPLVVAAGLGAQADRYTTEAVRRAAGAATRELGGRTRVLSTLGLVNGAQPDPALLVAAGEGALLGAYRFTRYKTDAGAPAPEQVSLAVPDAKDKASRAAMRRATAVVAAVTFARDLVNLAPNELYPAEFAARAAEAAGQAGVDVEVLDEKALRKGG